MRELAAQAFMMLFGGREPDPVIVRFVALVAQYEDNLVLNVDRKAAEHGVGPGRQSGDRLEHELVRDGLALLYSEVGIVQRESARIAARLRHRIHYKTLDFS